LAAFLQAALFLEVTMAVKTDYLPVDENYVKITDGAQSHLALFIQFNAKLRIVLLGTGDSPTDANPEFFTVSSGLDEFTGHRLSMTFDNLEPTDDIFVRTEKGEDHIIVVRGNVEIRGR
jgi:hypothetical protein